MSKFAAMAGLINDDSDRNPSERRRRIQTIEKVRPPQGSRFYTTLSRSRTVTISPISNRSMSRSKTPRSIVDSLQRRSPQPDGVQKKSDGVRSRGKKSSKLRSIISIVFPGHRRRRSPSLSSHSLSSSSRSSTMRSATDKRDSNFSLNLSLSSSSSSSRSSIGSKIDGRKKKKRQNSYGCGGSRGIIVNLASNRSGSLSRGNSVSRNGIKARRGKKEGEEEERYELCKKKILMGVKCKPLNSSGKLRYDDEGILIPEALPP